MIVKTILETMVLSQIQIKKKKSLHANSLLKTNHVIKVL